MGETVTPFLGIPDLAAALAKAQGQFKPVTKSKTAKVNSTKGSYEYKYSTLDELITATRDALSSNGLACFQPARTEGDRVVVSTVLLHVSGQVLVSPEIAFHGGGSPQTTGSALTYARRYSMSAALGVAAEDDDDGRAARVAARRDRREPDREPQRATPASSADPRQDARQEQTEGTAPPSQVARVRVVNTAYSSDGKGALYVVTVSDGGAFHTRSRDAYDVLSGLEGSPVEVDVMWRQGRRNDGSTVRVIEAVEVVGDFGPEVTS